MYISEHYLRKVRHFLFHIFNYIIPFLFFQLAKRDKANIVYNTSLPVIFGVKKYADALWKVVKARDIKVNLRTNLIEVKPKEKLAVFKKLDNPDETFTMEV